MSRQPLVEYSLVRRLGHHEKPAIRKTHGQWVAFVRIGVTAGFAYKDAVAWCNRQNALARRERVADAAWFLLKNAGPWIGMHQEQVKTQLRSWTPDRILCDAEDIQEQTARAADKFRELYVGRLIRDLI